MTLSLQTRILGTAMIAAGWAGTACAQGLVQSASPADAALRLELIESSRLGCSERSAMATVASGSQCAFDSATRGARFSAHHDFGGGALEAYGALATSTIGAFTPEQLLLAPRQRAHETANLFMLGIKGNALEGRLKVSAEFMSTQSVVDRLLVRDWAASEDTSTTDSSASVRVDATLADRTGFKWSLTGEYRSASDGFASGRSLALFPHVAIPGSRLALSSKARIGQLGVSAGVEQTRNRFGQSATRKVAADWSGLSLGLRSRVTRADPLEASTLLASETRSETVNLDVDTAQLAAALLPDVASLPFLVPTNLNLSYRSAETGSEYQSGNQRYGRSSLGIDGSWETPIGETQLSYWRDRRTGLSEGVTDRLSETMQISHAVRRGHWRFGLDASASRMRGEGGDYSDRSLSFGQSVAYSAPDGPEFRLQLGQDRNAMRSDGDGFAMDDSYSSVTASLDLSRYLQKRFERPDLRLTLDYRKAVDRSESEMSLEDELIERLTDADRREGFLVSFGMKL